VALKISRRIHPFLVSTETRLHLRLSFLINRLRWPHSR